MNLKFKSKGALKDYPISEVVGRFILFQEENHAQNIDALYKISYINSNLVFGYVFPLSNGVHIIKLTTASLDEQNNISMHKVQDIWEYKLFPQESPEHTIPLHEVADSDFIFADDLGSKFREKYYGCLPFIRNERIEEICRNSDLDEYRDDLNPLVIYLDGVRIKLENIHDDKFIGRLEDGERVLIDSDFRIVENQDQRILRILSKMDSSRSVNRRYLKNQFESHKDDPELSEVILKEYLKNLEGFDREIFSARMTEYLDEIAGKCERLIEESKMGEDRISEIEEMISGYTCEDDYVTSQIEKDIFRQYFDETAFIARHDLARMFMAYAVILNDNGRSEEALKHFKKSYCLNPVNVDNLIELSLYYLENDLEKCRKTIDLGFKYAYRVENMRELYYVLEEYYLRTSDYEKVEIIGEVLEGDYSRAFRNGIWVDFNPEIIGLICENFNFHKNEENYESAMYYLNTLVDMRKVEFYNFNESFMDFEYIEL
ncbi:MAG: hypothetical protein Q4P18_08395 [Methanobrevibacter sp.]|uniref:tetratricopeptide repeat protein n=1 Tax=Methanobrevibacter sp. TaxID=66852 RepID=UPI0026E10F1C|nr:hypothetical protein [Methanobrevibacter sp.]MDO5849542.1 hypothetical protein [Methanobrevibacter sp.]